jgi:hypothetical protein
MYWKKSVKGFFQEPLGVHLSSRSSEFSSFTFGVIITEADNPSRF